MSSFFSEPFMVRALIAALILGPCCGLLGVFVTGRRLSFFSDTVSHGALLGIGLGVMVGWQDSLWPMMLSGFAIAALMLWLQDKTDLGADTILALLLSGAVAAGMILVSLGHGPKSDAQGYLFGDILALGQRDLWVAGIAAAAVFGFVFMRTGLLAVWMFSEELVHIRGVSTRGLNLLFIVLLTVVVAVTVRLLGILLVTALLVIPAAAASLISGQLRTQMIWSALIGGVCAIGGVAISNSVNVPSGPAIVVCAIAAFLICLGISKLARRRGEVPK